MTDIVDPTAYWRKLKQRLKEEGNETVTNCHGLKLVAPDDKMRLTDIANKGILRLIQSIPSPKAELLRMDKSTYFDPSSMKRVNYCKSY